MAYDEDLAHRIREELVGEPDVTERTMFGGLGFMVAGNMAVAASSTGAMMVRVDPAQAESWMDGDIVRPMVMHGRPTDGWLLVALEALTSDDALQQWVGRGVARARALAAG